VRGRGFFNLLASFIRNFKPTEKLTRQTRGESFNTLNWVNPSGFASLNTLATNFGPVNVFRGSAACADRDELLMVSCADALLEGVRRIPALCAALEHR
jgi:hypothetical protein